MGQYYYTVNIDKKQFIHPHKLGDGLKLMEFGCSGQGVMMCLAVLLADGNGRGGGDLGENADCPAEIRNIVGSWAGDRIVVAGDYADPGKYGFDTDRAITNEDGEVSIEKELNLYGLACAEFEDISHQVLAAVYQDRWVLQEALETCAPKWKGETNYIGWNLDENLIAALKLNLGALKAAHEWAKANGVTMPEELQLPTPDPADPVIEPEFVN